MSHYITVNIPLDCTVTQYNDLLEANGLKFHDTQWKEERMEKDLTRIRGKTVKIQTDNYHYVESYHCNMPDRE